MLICIGASTCPLSGKLGIRCPPICIKLVHVLGLSHSIPYSPSLKSQSQNGNEAQYASHAGKEEEYPLISNLLGKIDRVECEGHPKLLPEEVEDLAYFAAFRPVTIDGVSVAGRCDDLETEAGNTHADDWCDPDRAVLDAEAYSAS